MGDTMATPGWWRRLSDDRRTQIGHQFWSVGRLTLEPWIPPTDPERVRSWPDSEVTRVAADIGDQLQVTLSNGATVTVDEVVTETGFRSELGHVNYLAGLLDTIAQRDFVLDENFATTVPGLTGFLATPGLRPVLRVHACRDRRRDHHRRRHHPQARVAAVAVGQKLSGTHRVVHL